MECGNCPYGIEEFAKIHDSLTFEDNPDYIEGTIWCNKTGGKIFWYGKCEDYAEIQTKQKCSKKKRMNKRERDLKHKKHLKFLAENIQGYPAPVIYTDEIYVKGQGYVENPKPYYKRMYRGRAKGRSRYGKKVSNRIIRKYKGCIPRKGNWSHRLYDFWWEIY